LGRKILFVTTDQQRFDALGCNGGTIARTPVIDALAKEGVRYTRAHANSVVCQPARSSMLTGQFSRTHGVTMNGMELPHTAPSVAEYLRDNGYRTALLGKAHFDPLMDPAARFAETKICTSGSSGPLRGFEHVGLATHTVQGWLHYALDMKKNHAQYCDGFYPVIDVATLDVNGAGGGDTGAVQVKHNPVPKELYHTEWVTQKTIAWLDSLDAKEDWFCWLSFPDPHHPWDPPQSELHRVNWRDLDLPKGYLAREQAEKVLGNKPRQWLDWYLGKLVTNFEAPPNWVPANMTSDQLREVDAMNHIENELIDEALGKVMQTIHAKGWGNDTDVIFTADHGELQGDFGLLFKGPYHCDALMRLPMIWRPAKSANIAAAEVSKPVQQTDLAPTFCAIAGLPVPEWMQGAPMPHDNEQAHRDWSLTEWDSNLRKIEQHLRTVYHEDGDKQWVATFYEKGTIHDGTEGELYNLSDDPLQHHNRFHDQASAVVKQRLYDLMQSNLPPKGPELQRLTPV
jgi:arylsulfatase A-like enzyme